MAWPSQSPDIKFIVNVWKTIKVWLQRNNHLIETDKVKEIWAYLPPHYIELIVVNSKMFMTCYHSKNSCKPNASFQKLPFYFYKIYFATLMAAVLMTVLASYCTFGYAPVAKLT